MPRYFVLRIYIVLLRIAAVALLIVGTVAVLSGTALLWSIPSLIATGNPNVDRPVTVVSQVSTGYVLFQLFVVIGSSIAAWAFSDFLTAHIDTAVQTRLTANILAEIAYGDSASPQPPPQPPVVEPIIPRKPVNYSSTTLPPIDSSHRRRRDKR